VSAIRLSPSAELKPYHRYQHIYTFFLYSLATLSWLFSKDYVKFFENKVGNFSNRKHPKEEYFYLFFYKACCYTIFLVIPILVLDHPWYYTVAGFILCHLVAGFYLAIVFALAHEVEDVHFPLPQMNGTVENEWLMHQLYTTANFCTGSQVAAFLTGGLNQQVEHHLFPNICTIHYPALAKIVQETAREFNLPYYDKPSFLSALKSHYTFLKKMGREKDYVPASVAGQKVGEIQMAG
jgi:linoleoyl-CoA desaturase